MLGQSAGYFGRETGCGRPVFDPELWINVFKMFAHGCSADSEDRTDLGVGFSAGEPAEDLALTQSQQPIAMIASDR
jgi:hypothetical protein